MEKLDIEKRLKKESPEFYKEYKYIILNIIEDYIYIEDFTGKDDYLLKEFESYSIENIDISEIDRVRCIVTDIVQGKYENRLGIFRNNKNN